MQLNGYMYPLEKVLNSVTDEMGRTTSYVYDYRVFKASMLNRELTTAFDNMYTLLQKVNYPTGAWTFYLYQSPYTSNFGVDGSKQFFKLSNRQDHNSSNMGMSSNRFDGKLYLYNQDSTGEIDGYPNYFNETSIPTSYTVKSKEEVLNGYESNNNIYIYNKERLCIEQQLTGDDHKVEKYLTYDTNNQPTKQLPKATTKHLINLLKWSKILSSI